MLGEHSATAFLPFPSHLYSLFPVFYQGLDHGRHSFGIQNRHQHTGPCIFNHFGYTAMCE